MLLAPFFVFHVSGRINHNIRQAIRRSVNGNVLGPEPACHHIDKVTADNLFVPEPLPYRRDVRKDQEIIQLAGHHCIFQPLVHQRMCLRLHVDPVFLLLHIPQGHLRIIHKADQIDIVEDFHHGLQDLHFFMYFLLLLFDHFIFPEGILKIIHDQLYNHIAGNSHHQRFDGKAPHYIQKIRERILITGSPAHIVRRCHPRRLKHQDIVQTQRIEIQQPVTEQNAQERHKEPRQMDAYMAIRHINDQDIQRGKREHARKQRMGKLLHCRQMYGGHHGNQQGNHTTTAKRYIRKNAGIHAYRDRRPCQCKKPEDPVQVLVHLDSIVCHKTLIVLGNYGVHFHISCYFHISVKL